MCCSRFVRLFGMRLARFFSSSWHKVTKVTVTPVAKAQKHFCSP
jgi:hypothetical protein